MLLTATVWFSSACSWIISISDAQRESKVIVPIIATVNTEASTLAAVADGQSEVTIKMTLTDSNGTPIPDQPMSIRLLDSDSTAFECSLTDPVGVSICKIKSAITGEKTILSNLSHVTLDPTKILFFSLKAEPVYSTAPNWNDYVKVKDIALGKEGQDDQPCDIEPLGKGILCLHGGEIRKVELPKSYFPSCSNYFIKDQLDNFDWDCKETSDELRFYSSLKQEGGLRYLVNRDSWKENRLLLFRNNGSQYAQGPLEIWWTNPVIPLPQNPEGLAVELSDPGAIYTLDQNRTTFGYVLRANKISIVTLNGSQLAGAITALNWDSATGRIAEPKNSVLIGSKDNRFLWIEAQADMAKTTMSAVGLSLINTHFSRIHRWHLKNNFIYAVWIRDSKHNYLEDLVFANSVMNTSSALGLYISGAADHNRIQRMKATSISRSAIIIHSTAAPGPTNNVVANSIFAFNNNGPKQTRQCNQRYSLLS